MNAQQMPAAVLWDFDGSLLDSEPIWIQAKIDIMTELGVPWGWTQARELCGVTWQHSSAMMRRDMHAAGVDFPGSDWDLALEQHRRVIASLDSGELPWIPGADVLLEDLRAHQIPMAVVSASPLNLIEAGTNRMGEGTFGIIVNGTQVSRGKPDPEGYRMAAEGLGVAPDHCVVIEDSLSGVQAGLNAGALVIAVKGQHEIPDAPSQVKVDDLRGFSYATLVDLWSREKEA